MATVYQSKSCSTKLSGDCAVFNNLGSRARYDLSALEPTSTPDVDERGRKACVTAVSEIISRAPPA